MNKYETSLNSIKNAMYELKNKLHQVPEASAEQEDNHHSFTLKAQVREPYDMSPTQLSHLLHNNVK
jgi:hypothetical protein